MACCRPFGVMAHVLHGVHVGRKDYLLEEDWKVE